MKTPQVEFEVSERRACDVLDQPRSTQCYASQPRDVEAAMAKAMLKLIGQRLRFGYRRIGRLLLRDRCQMSGTRVYGLWRREGLKVPRKKLKKRRLSTSENGCQRRRAEFKDHVWCWDFVSDHTTNGAPLKWLSIVDEFTRECLASKADRSITSEDFIDTLAELFPMRGVPKCIRNDNGPEFVANAIQTWLVQLKIETLHIARGSPWENGYAESFHSRLRNEFLGMEEFESLVAARTLSVSWKEDYNNHRPFGSLAYQTPSEFSARLQLPLGRAVTRRKKGGSGNTTANYHPGSTGVDGTGHRHDCRFVAADRATLGRSLQPGRCGWTR